MTHPRRVAITGLGVVSPIGIGKDAFWQNLLAGRSGVDYVHAFDPSPYPCHVAAEVTDFHPADFMATRKARVMGRFSQLAVAATRLALDDACLTIRKPFSSQIAIYYGTSVSGGGDIAAVAFEAHHKEGVEGISPSSALEYPGHAATSYLAIEFGISGPAISISSNCCTGIDAIYSGYSEIVAGNATTAIVGASDAPVFPFSFGALCANNALTRRNSEPTKASRPYDALRDGIVIGEGAATLVLENLEVAQDRGAPIYAEILGHGAASEAIGMYKADPSGRAMATAISLAIRHANLVPSDIDHVNAHGCSIPDYDICDTNAFKAAFGPHAYRIPITSIKSMIGHPLSAASALQAVAASMSIQTQMVPPTINQEVPDPQCDLDYVPNVYRVARIKHVLFNAHGSGGSVAALVVGTLTP